MARIKTIFVIFHQRGEYISSLVGAVERESACLAGGGTRVVSVEKDLFIEVRGGFDYYRQGEKAGEKASEYVT